MKTAITILAFVLIVFLFRNYNHSTNIQYASLTTNTSNLYYNNLINFQKEVNKLNLTIEKIKSKRDIARLQKQLVRTRLAYKKIEFLFDYLHPLDVYLAINGAPLTKFNENTSVPVEPNGLQTLDELIYSSDTFNELESIKTISNNLKNALQTLVESDYNVKIRDVQIIEALRSGCVRVFTLGVTGFDTPGSNNAMLEALESFKSMHATFSLFEKTLQTPAKESFYNNMALFTNGIKYLKANSDFDSFNRLTFLKDVINPLYNNLSRFQFENNIDTNRSFYHAQDYNSTNIFSEDFLSTEHYSEFSILPLNNPETIQLGKKLFYDTNLSNNNTMSCATCHDPEKGFADGLAKSQTNTENVFTARNSPTLINSAFASRYFWDLREFNLEKQVSHVVENKLEFDIDFDLIIRRLSRNRAYINMFDSCYNGVQKKTISSRTISNAIAAYVNSLKSFNSPFDKYVRDEIKEYPKEAENGFNLFMGKAACGTCHFAPAFNGTVPPFYTETESEVLGLTIGFDTINPILDTDLGRFSNGLDRQLDMYRNSFKTVTIRNVELTAPYMHNGSFETLEDVLEFYNLGGGSGMGLEVENQTLSSEPLGLSSKEKSNIIAFLNTLTDTTGLTNTTIKLP